MSNKSSTTGSADDSTVPVSRWADRRTGEYVRRIAAAVRAPFARVDRTIAARSGTSLFDDRKAEYIATIVSLDDSLDRIVRAGDIETETQHSIADITAAFGSWQAALDAAGVDRRAQIQAELRRVEGELGHRPSPDELNEFGHVSATMVRNTFESYERALDIADSSADESPGAGSLARRLRRAGLSGGLAANCASAVGAGLAVSRRSVSRVRDRLGAVGQRVTALRPSGDVSNGLNGGVQRVRRVVPTAKPGALGNAVTDAVGSVSPSRPVDHERRDFLKYAGLSTTVAVGLSSSDALFGTDGAPTAQGYGYGGAPLDSAKASDDTDGAGTVTQTPTAAGAVTPTPTGSDVVSSTPTSQQTPPQDSSDTANDSGGDSTAPTDDGRTDTPDDGNTGSTEDGNTGSTEDGNTGSTDDGDTGSTEDSNTGSTEDSNTGSTEDGDTGSSGGSTETTTPTEPDRYNETFQDTEQGYGEQGYGGVST